MSVPTQECPVMIDLLCVDAAAQEDLMMLDQLARTVMQRQAAGARQMVIQGSGETHERKLETRGLDIARKDGALTCTDPLLELAFRETNRSWANRLTDEGLYALALLGSDRGLLQLRSGRIEPSNRLETTAWPSPAVVPVLGSLARDVDGGLHDVHPVRVAQALVDARPDAFRIVVLTRRTLPRNMAGQPVPASDVVQNGWLDRNFPLPSPGIRWFVADAPGWATESCVEVQ